MLRPAVGRRLLSANKRDKLEAIDKAMSANLGRLDPTLAATALTTVIGLGSLLWVRHLDDSFVFELGRFFFR